MAKRPTINTLANTASPTYLTQLNQNFTNVQTQFDNTLSLDGSTPNAMNADLDMNGNDILNAKNVTAFSLNLGGVQIIPNDVNISANITTRAEFVTSNNALIGLGLNDGQVVSAGGLQYRRQTGATAIPDLPGWVPNLSISPGHFGAAGDYILPSGAANGSPTNDTTAMNAMFAYVRGLVSAGFYRPFVIDGRGLGYYCAGSVNATGIYSDNRGGAVQNLFIYSAASGKVALDVCGSNLISWTNCHVMGLGSTAASWPLVGWLFARTTTAATECFGHTLINCSCDGKFRDAGFINYAAELHRQVSCKWLNRANNSAGQPGEGYLCLAMVDQASDIVPVTSDFQTVITGFQSNTTKYYVGCRASKPYGTPGTALLLNGQSNCHYTGLYVSSGDGTAIEWHIGTFVTRDYNVTLDVQAETTGLDTLVKFVGTGATAHEVADLRMRCGNMFLSSAVFDASGITSITMPNFDFVATKLQAGTTAPTNGWFHTSQKSKFFLRNARVSLPSTLASFSVREFGGFTGVMNSGATDDMRIVGTHATGLNRAVVADDAVVSIAIPSHEQYGRFTLMSTYGTVGAVLTFRSSSSPAIMSSSVGSAVNTVTATTLAGTTGADGKITIAVNQNQIQIENRAGFSVTFFWEILAAG